MQHLIVYTKVTGPYRPLILVPAVGIARTNRPSLAFSFRHSAFIIIILYLCIYTLVYFILFCFIIIHLYIVYSYIILLYCHTRAHLTIPDHLISIQDDPGATSGTIFYLIWPADRLARRPQE